MPVPPPRQPPEAEPTREHTFSAEEPSFIDEPLPEDSITGDWAAAGSGEDWAGAGEPRMPPLPAGDQPLPRSPSARRIRRRRILAALVVFVVALLVAFAVLLFQPFHGAGHGRVKLTIPKGSSASAIADILDSKGVVSNSTLFRLRLDLSGKSGEIQAGKYTLAHDMSYGDAIDALTTKPTPIKPKTVTVTIPEGYDRQQMAELLRKDGVKGDYLSDSKSFKGFDPAKYGAKDPANLEGFLFPATYKLKPKQDAKDLVGQQLAAFTQNIKQVKMGYARSKNLTTYDVVTIASIVQREAGNLKDFPTVAAVVYNRLHDGMPLQVDATIRFAEHNYTKPLTYSDLHLDSPYNSYTNTGLPPGPISNPGLAALNAAARPANVPYLYYVTKPGACGRLCSRPRTRRRSASRRATTAPAPQPAASRRRTVEAARRPRAPGCPLALTGDAQRRAVRDGSGGRMELRGDRRRARGVRRARRGDAGRGLRRRQRNRPAQARRARRRRRGVAGRTGNRGRQHAHLPRGSRARQHRCAGAHRRGRRGGLGTPALVLGAGGSARACVWALVSEGAEVMVWNRTRERAERLAQDLGAAGGARGRRHARGRL